MEHFFFNGIPVDSTPSSQSPLLPKDRGDYDSVEGFLEKISWKVKYGSRQWDRERKIKQGLRKEANLYTLFPRHENPVTASESSGLRVTASESSEPRVTSVSASIYSVFSPPPEPTKGNAVQPLGALSR